VDSTRKALSKRLLIFTESQAFYHCARAPFFEDTILETKDELTRSIQLLERSSPYRKDRGTAKSLVYGAHRPIVSRNFWGLVEAYSGRQLSFDKDSLCAFGGILASIKQEYGPDVWGIPQRLFSSEPLQ
jgi:hypothetical protein